MRTFEEIDKDIQEALGIDDASALHSLAEEMKVHDTPKAAAVASYALGAAEEFTGKYPAAVDQYRRAQVLYEELGDRAGVARVATSIGNVYQATGKYPAAMEHYRLALALNETLGDRAGVARVSTGIGNVFYNTGDFPSAMEQYRLALALHEESGDRSGAARVTGNMGNVYHYTGDFPTALEYNRRALALHEELGDRSGVARLTGNIGNVYHATGDYPSAMEHYRRALALHEGSGDLANVAIVIGNMGNVYHYTGDIPLAMEHYGRALALHEELGNSAGVVYVIGVMVETLVKVGRHDEAAQLLERQATMRLDNPTVMALYNVNRARLSEHKGDLDEAHDLVLQALTITINGGLRAESAEIHKSLRDLAQKRNDFAGYIEHNNEFQRISEEIRGKEVTQRMAMMEAERKAEGERREREKERAVLYSTLPKHVADRVVRGEKVTGDHYDHATVIFLDIVGFTAISDSIPPGHVVHLLEQIFTTLDVVCKKHDVTKIKTIGDSYMAVSFESIENAAQCALDMLDALAALTITMPPDTGDTSWTKDVGEIQVRIGMHCGPVTAGVIGTERMQYDVWGDTVNVASRMESSGLPGRCHVTRAVVDAIENHAIENHAIENHAIESREYRIEERGEIDVKGKGMMMTYWLERPS